jgi:hypothetical protein
MLDYCVQYVTCSNLIFKLPHGNDTISHELDFTQPFLLQFRSVQDGANKTSTVDGRVRIHGTNQNFDLRVDASLFSGVFANNGESTNTFTIQAHVLGKGLGKDNGVVSRNELAKSIGIPSTVTRCETLVGHIEEGEMIAILKTPAKWCY